MKKLFYTLLFLVIFVFGLTFAARNPQTIEISYYFDFKVEIPVIVFLLLVLVSGMILGWILAHVGQLKRGRKRRLKQRSRKPAATDLVLPGAGGG